MIENRQLGANLVRTYPYYSDAIIHLTCNNVNINFMENNTNFLQKFACFLA